MWDTEPSPRNPSGVRIDPDTALRSTVVLACARVLAESIGGLPLHLYKRDPSGGKSIAREHPLYNVLHSTPNSWQTSFEWREQAMLHLCLHGNAYNELRAGIAGAVSELIPLHPSRMKVERIENGRLRYVYTEPSGEKTIYTQDQIMHLRWLSNDGVTGMVPVELARDAIGLARACEIHGASYFGNGARPGIVLETDNMIPQEAATALRDNWERTHRGADRASKTAVLMGGLKAHELGGNNQESQFLESRRFQVEEICRLYRVPPHLVGDLTRSSFSNIEQQSIDFVQHTLLPWLRRFETAFARDLIVDSVTYFAEFDTRGLLRGDASARASYYQTLWNLGVASVNEIRGWENLNPVEAGDTRFVQLNMQTLEQASKPPAPPAAAPGLPGAAASPAPPATQPPTGAAPQGPKLAQPAGRALWQEFSEELVSDGHEARSLTISVDFDQTFSADPELWGSFALDAVEAGNTVVMITRREDTPENQSAIAETLGDYAEAFSTVLLIGPETLKDDAAQKAGISVDVWIDDSPQTVMRRGFCPTGKGGGTDNSCSSKDGGGGGGDSIPDASALSRVKNLGGSTGAVLMKNEAGDQFVVKSGNSAGHVRSEAATNDIYAAIGVAVPKHKLDESDKSSPKQVSEYLDGAKPLGSLKGAAREKAIASLRENFAADALVANWDVVGLNEDNVLVKGGEAYRVDNGGSLTYRAQGAEKKFGPTVGEIDSLRSSDQGRPIFGSLKNEEVASQIRKLASKRQKILRATPQPLRGVMAQRLDYMENWAKTAGSTPSERAFCPTGKGGGTDNSCSSKEGGGGSDSGAGYQKGTRKGIKEGQQVKIQKKGSVKVHEGVVQTVTHDGSKTTVVYKDKFGKTNTITIANAASVEMKAAAGFNKTGDAAALAKSSGAQLAKPEPKQAAPKEPDDGVAKDKNGVPLKPPEGMPTGWSGETAKFDRTPLQDGIAKTPTAAAAISAYTGSDYASLNAALREGRGPGQNYKGKSLKDAVKDAKSKWDVALVAALDIATQVDSGTQRSLYRGTRSEGLAKQLSAMKPGDEFTDTGFGSASRSYGSADSFTGDGGVMFKIRTSYGLPISDLSQHGHEREVLLPRNLKYRLVKHEWRKQGGRRSLHVEVETVGIEHNSYGW
jgi:HK97 family phage portal protein